MRRQIPSHCIEPFLASANRRHLWGGMEFPAFIASFWAPLMILMGVPNRYTMAGSIVLWFLLRFLFRAMANKEPFMTDLYLDSLKYRQPDRSLEYPATQELCEPVAA